VNRRSRTWALEVASEPVNDGIVLVPKGRIGSVTASVFADAVTAALAAAPRVIIDLSEVDYISGAGVSILHQAAATNGKRTILCGLREAVRITLELGGVLERLPVLQSRHQALELP
jgi:anti-sigma B factor antagonist